MIKHPFNIKGLCLEAFVFREQLYHTGARQADINARISLGSQQDAGCL